MPATNEANYITRRDRVIGGRVDPQTLISDIIGRISTGAEDHAYEQSATPSFILKDTCKCIKGSGSAHH